MANSYDFNIIQNVNFTLRLIAQNSDGTPIDLTGLTTSGYVRVSYGNTGILYNFFATPDSSLVSGILWVSGKYPQNLPIGQFVQDVIAKDIDNNEIILLNGRFNVNPIVTY